jgi:hypothetical protein
MTYILTAQRHGNLLQCFKAYEDYIRINAERFPPGALSLATSPWYFDFNHHHCPHDSWLEWINISESSIGSRNEIRCVSFTVRLFAAYHDGYIELNYPKIFSYRLGIVNSTKGHLDWRYDEFRISDHDTLIHEIEWCGSQVNGTWYIEASDVEFKWISPVNAKS